MWRFIILLEKTSYRSFNLQAMFHRFFGCLHLCIFIIFVDFNQSQKSLLSLMPGSIRTASKPEVPASTNTPLPYCENNTQSPYICGENCITAISNSDTIVFFQSINFPLAVILYSENSLCYLNFILNSTDSKVVSCLSFHRILLEAFEKVIQFLEIVFDGDALLLRFLIFLKELTTFNSVVAEKTSNICFNQLRS